MFALLMQGPRFSLGTGRKLREMVESNVREPPPHAVRKKIGIGLAGGLGGVKMLAVNPDNLFSPWAPHDRRREPSPTVVLQPPHECTHH